MDNWPVKRVYYGHNLHGKQYVTLSKQKLNCKKRLFCPEVDTGHSNQDKPYRTSTSDDGTVFNGSKN